MGYIYSSGKYKKARCSIPKIIHNRAITFSTYGKKRLKKLARVSTIFNRTNRFGKYGIHKLLLQQ
ncbi:hypothetical protein ACVLD2_000298 [Paenibacillus sp. PvR052]|nr:hypothetical protein [Paenibacillus sp. PvP091]MBP1168832.1 hypothetical protein [Paenibacillus sp. PvR098]MBP2439860.1 hypothetical protein [Paenibacillus sp. PvP052]